MSLKTRTFIGLAAFAITAGVVAQTPVAPAHEAAEILFDGHGLDQFETFSPSKGMNNDSDHIFTVEGGVIHVSGREFGALVTKREYSSYTLTAEFKWGEGTYAPRAGKARDAGILYDVTGPMQIWPSSAEFQMQEGATGDIYLCNGFAMTSAAGQRVIGKPGSYVGINRIGKGPWKDETGYRDPSGDPEKPHGEWNSVELVVRNGDVEYFVNGKLVNRATDLVVVKGKIIFQSEGAEVFYRNIRLVLRAD